MPFGSKSRRERNIAANTTVTCQRVCNVCGKRLNVSHGTDPVPSHNGSNGKECAGSGRA